MNYESVDGERKIRYRLKEEMNMLGKPLLESIDSSRSCLAESWLLVSVCGARK